MSWLGCLLLVWRYIRSHPLKAGLITGALAVVFLLPLILYTVVRDFEQTLTARSRSTQLVLGPRAGKLELTLAALHFEQPDLPNIPQRVLDELSDSVRGNLYPIHNRHRVVPWPLREGGEAESFPLVGCDYGYFSYRHLSMKIGRWPTYLGEVVLGHEVARQWGVLEQSTGQVLSVPHHLLDLSKTVQLRLPVVGVLARSGGPDDRAVFSTLRSNWALDGFAHSHRDVRGVGKPDASGNNIMTPANFASDDVLDEKSRDRYHLHESPDELPLTAILIDPERHEDLLKVIASYERDSVLMVVRPETEVSELLEVILNLSVFFDVHLAISLAACGALIVVILLLSHRLRTAERDTLRLIGFPNRLYPTLVGLEIGIYMFAAFSLAAFVALGIGWILEDFSLIQLFSGLA